VLEALIPPLARDYRITWMGVGYTGPVVQWTEGVRLEPTNLTGGDVVGACGARERWADLKADLVFALNDLWYLEHYSRELAGCLEGVPMVGYLPLDGRIDNPQLVSRLIGFDHLLTYTEVASQDLADALRKAANPTPVSKLGHGVDLRRFRPLLDMGGSDLRAQRMQRAQDFFGLPGPAFVVLNAARPDPRKRIDLTLQAFARFVQGRSEDMRLCLHQAFAHPDYVDPLRTQAQALGIAERILWHPREPGPISDEALNALYNACAVGINTAAGEGFGLVSFEHAATGVPQVLPDQPALRELWGAAATRLRARPQRTDHSPLMMVEACAAEGASALTRLHDDDGCYDQMARAAWARSGQKDLQWERHAKQLAALLRRILQSHPTRQRPGNTGLRAEG
jgi:glycosyltransferase involved in cell wall biosynthesis